MSRSSHTSKSADGTRGFSLVELLVVVVAGGVLLVALTGFYVSNQRAIRRNEVEIETSQALRAAMEQMTRDFRLIGRDVTRAPGFTRFNAVSSTDVDFNIDTDDDGIEERFEYKLNGSTLQKCCSNHDPSGNNSGYDCGGTGYQCSTLADFVTGVSFNYYTCGQTLIANPNSNLTSIGRIDLSVTVSQGTVGGTNVTRTEADTVTLRNLCN